MTPYIPLVHPVLQDRQGTLPGPVWVVDDDDVRDSIAFALQTRFNVVMHPSSDQLLSRAELSQPGCIIIDMHARGMNGLDFLHYLNVQRSPASVIFLSSHATVRTAVALIEAGAAGFFEKPVDPDQLAPAVEKALQLARRKDWKLQLKELVVVLSHRERQIFEFVSQGLKNNEIAEKLFLSQRTVEVHRAHITRKIGQAAPTRILYELSLANDDGIFPIPPKKRAKED